MKMSKYEHIPRRFLLCEYMNYMCKKSMHSLIEETLRIKYDEHFVFYNCL